MWKNTALLSTRRREGLAGAGVSHLTGEKGDRRRDGQMDVRTALRKYFMMTKKIQQRFCYVILLL